MGGGGAAGQNIFTEPVNHDILLCSSVILIVLTVGIEKGFEYLRHHLKDNEQAFAIFSVSRKGQRGVPSGGGGADMGRSSCTASSIHGAY